MAAKKKAKKEPMTSPPPPPAIPGMPTGPDGQPIPMPVGPDGRPISSADVIKSMKNSIKISIGDAEENILKIFDTVIGQLGAAAQQINKQAAHINSLEGFFKDNNIPLDVVIPKGPGTKGPNRETRRKIAKVAEKYKKKSKSSK